MENRKKFEELMEDEDFVMKILELQTSKDVKAEFEANGVSISEEEIEELTREFGAISDAIDEEDLSNISGGKKTWDDVFDKAWDKFGEGMGNAAWIIPTAIVTRIVTWWMDKKLKAYEEKLKLKAENTKLEEIISQQKSSKKSK